MKTYKFTAGLKKTLRGGYGVDVPLDVKKEFGTKGMVKVKTKISGIDYRGSLTPMGGGNHILIVVKKIREELGVKEGDKLKIELAEDKAPRLVEVPADLKKLFTKNKKAKEIFDGMSYTHRKEYVNWINEAKKEETRQRRLIKAIEMLLEKKHL